MTARIPVLIPDGEQWISLHVARALHRSGNVEVHVMSTRPRVPIRHSRAVKSFEVSEPGDEAARIEHLREVAARTGAAVLLPVHEQAIRFASLHREVLGGFIAVAPVPDVAAINTLADKRDFARFLDANAIPHPETIVVEDEVDIATAIGCLTMPVLAKPAIGSGGRGIVQYKERSTLESALQTGGQTAATLVIQEFVHGSDIDSSVLCSDGEIVAHTIQKSVIESRKAYAPPVGLAFVDHEKVLEVTRATMRALKWTGVAHLDFRMTERGDDVRLIEVNPRFWASVMASVEAGVNVPYLSVLAALGRDLPESNQRDIRWVSGPASIGAVLTSPFRPRDARYTFRRSSLNAFVSDPRAELSRVTGKILRQPS